MCRIVVLYGKNAREWFPSVSEFDLVFRKLRMFRIRIKSIK